MTAEMSKVKTTSEAKVAAAKGWSAVGKMTSTMWSERLQNKQAGGYTCRAVHLLSSPPSFLLLLSSSPPSLLS